MQRLGGEIHQDFRRHSGHPPFALDLRESQSHLLAPQTNTLALLLAETSHGLSNNVFANKVVSDILLITLATLVAIILMAPLLYGYVWIRTIPERRKERAFALRAQSRPKLTDLNFCIRSGLPVAEVGSVATLRKSFGQCLNIAPDFVYPEDEIASYGLYYDDNVSGLIHSCGLISKNPYWFPLEDGSNISDIFPWIQRINSEQGIAPNDR